MKNSEKKQKSSTTLTNLNISLSVSYLLLYNLTNILTDPFFTASRVFTGVFLAAPILLYFAYKNVRRSKFI